MLGLKNKKRKKKKDSQHVVSIFSFLYMAYFWVHSFACLLYFSLSFLYMCAMSGTKGSSGFGSQSNEHMDNKTLDTVRAGDH